MKLARRLLLAALPAALLVTSAAPALAAWPNDPGVNVKVAPSAGHQENPLTVADGEGGAFVVWSESNDVRAQHLTVQGLRAPGWPANGITICNAPAAQYPAAATPDGTGGVLVVWNDYRNGADSDLYAQRVTGAGALLWGATGLPVATGSGDQGQVGICADRAGGAVFVWQDSRNSGTTGFDVYAQRLSANGTPSLGGAGQAVCVVAGDQGSVTVVNDGTVGGCFAVWRDRRNGNWDLFATRLDASGNPRSGWIANGSALCVQPGDQDMPALASDGNFGAYATWADPRSGPYDIFAMRMTATSPAAPGWAANGVNLTSDGSFQFYPQVVADASGAVIVWEGGPGSDIFAQRVNPGGSVAWTPGGVTLTGAPGIQSLAVPVSDGAGGAVVAWVDYRAGQPQMAFAQHVTGAGTIASGWAADGNAVSTAHWVQSLGGCSDGSGGALFSWQHIADVPTIQLYAQRIDRWGYLGAQARIASVRDVPSDQGGRVKVSWDRSPVDAYPDNAIGSYLLYRSVPPQLALAQLARQRTDETEGAIFLTELAGTTTYWEQVATVAAGQLPGYSYLAPTAQDSVAGSNPRTQFMVRAQALDGVRYWLSDPDSGYSTDNLPPYAPAPFTGNYAAGGTHLHWDPNVEPDFALYRLYRGTSAGFVPGPGNLVSSQPDTGHVDTGPAGGWYKLIAVDAHGNESPATLLSPSGTLDTPGPGSFALALAHAFPNPAKGPVQCRFTLPAEGHVRVTVHDVAGRVVRVLVDGRLPAGEHLARWAGDDAAGRSAPGGLYFVRLDREGRSLRTRLVKLD